MAQESDHIALANGNHEVLLELLSCKKHYPEWVTTVAFYKAVQIVEAAIRNQLRRNSSNHDDRLGLLKRGRFKDKPLFKHLRFLLNASMIARYLCDTNGKDDYKCFSDFLPAANVVEEVIRRRLVPLEQTALEFLSDSAKKDLRKTNPAHLPRTPGA
jgi:hypothetical protein